MVLLGRQRGKSDEGTETRTLARELDREQLGGLAPGLRTQPPCPPAPSKLPASFQVKRQGW